MLNSHNRRQKPPTPTRAAYRHHRTTPRRRHEFVVNQYAEAVEVEPAPARRNGAIGGDAGQPPARGARPGYGARQYHAEGETPADGMPSNQRVRHMFGVGCIVFAIPYVHVPPRESAKRGSCSAGPVTLAIQ